MDPYFLAFDTSLFEFKLEVETDVGVKLPLVLDNIVSGTGLMRRVTIGQGRKTQIKLSVPTDQSKTRRISKLRALESLLDIVMIYTKVRTVIHHELGHKRHRKKNILARNIIIPVSRTDGDQPGINLKRRLPKAHRIDIGPVVGIGNAAYKAA